MAHIYILSTSSGKYYVGSTDNLSRRLEHHKGGHTPSTKRLGALQLIFSQEYPTLAAARKVERRLKRLKRKDYLEKIIREGKITSE